jgi:class 3 adenylate cyclase
MGEELKLLNGFLPVRLFGKLRGGDVSPAAVEFSAAVMFVDVSRYTSLVEQLARRGQEGLEKIQRVLTQSYTRCAEEICDRGGEVIYFAGDCLLAYWSEDDGNLKGAIAAAAACADAICRHQDGQNVRDEIGPPLHVGIGAGSMWAAAIGGRPTWTLITGGDAVGQAAASQALAHRSDYALSDRAAEYLAGGASERFGPRFARERKGSSPPADWLLDFLPPQVKELLLTSGTVIHAASGQNALAIDSDRHLEARLQSASEIRPISALFARIQGLDHRDPSVVARCHELYILVQDILRTHGGPPGEFVVDDKGLVLAAAFGTPRSFHRDDARRAVAVARALEIGLEHLGLVTSIGMATGDALVGVVGNFRRRQLMVLGAPMNRAARLMTAQPNGILCDVATERASRTVFHFEKRGVLQLAGLGDMAAVFRPVITRDGTISAATLIGRDNELELLKRTFDETRNGGKRLLVVFGESGIGKTALVTTFTKQLNSAGVTVAIARAEREDRRTSLLPWRRLLASLLGLRLDIESVAVFEETTRRVRDHPALLGKLALLDGVLGIPIPENDSTRHLQGAHRADATMRLLGDLVGVLAPQPLTLVLEDGQWLDSASWRLVEWVLASRSSILLILCVRSEEVPEELKALQRRADSARTSGTESDDPARFCRMLDLGELSDNAIRELVARTLGEVPPHHELAQAVSELAGGNPLFAEEIALSLKSEGLIAVRDGLWRSLRPLDTLQYFERVERVIRERVDRLEPTVLAVLKAAAVIGRSFDVAALAILLESLADDHGIEQMLESLVAARFVQMRDGGGHYEFRHDQIRDVVYGSIPFDTRQRLHGRLAQWIEANQSSATGADIAVLAQHFEAAGETQKALKYANLAASKALEVGAFREVEAFLSICLSHEPHQRLRTLEQRLEAVRWRRQLAEACYGRGDIHAQGVAVRRALTLAGQSIPRSSLLVTMRLIASATQLACQQLALPAFSRSEARKRWEQELARCKSQAAMVDYFELRFMHGMCYLIEAVVHAERTGVTTEMAIASAQVACGLGIMGFRRAGEHFLAKAEGVALALGDSAIHSHVCNLEALWRIGIAEWRIVDSRLKQSQDLCLRAGDQLRWGGAQVIRFWSQYYRGDWGALEQTAQSLLSHAQNSGNIQQEVWALRCKSLFLLHADRAREAADLLRLIASAMLGSADLAAQVSCKGALSLALARTGRHGRP